VTPFGRATVALSASALLGACASIPKDAGFGNVHQTVSAETGQKLEWDPSKPVQPPDDAAVAALLQEPMTADRAVQIAFANNRDLQATLEGLGVARAELIAASTLRNPVFHAEMRFPGSPHKPYEIGLVQTLLDLINLGSRKKRGRAQFAAVQVRVAGAAMNFAGQVRREYYDVLAARKMLLQQETILKAQGAATELAGRQHLAGNITDLDLETEQSRYEQAKLDYARSQLEELVARERLVTALGLVQRAEIRLPDDFPELPSTEPTVPEVEQQVAMRRLDLRVAQRDIEAAQAALGVAGTAVLDDLNIGVHLEKEPDGKLTTGPSVEVPVPIFDRGAAQKTGARARLRQSQQRLAALTVSARSEARAALERLLEARARMTYLRDVVIPRRERILRLTQLEYNAMLRGVFQLIEARQELASAHREEVSATRDYWTARTELDTAVSGVGRFSVRDEAAEGPRAGLTAAMPGPNGREHE
jgi:cobalt-zinc-cadmium efflux system outer membrane protein